MSNEKVKLYHITDETNWLVHKHNGLIRISEKFVRDKYSILPSDRPFIEAYEWMRYQMHKRIPNRYYNYDAYPVWAWYQYRGRQKKRPDLRETGHLAKGTKGVRITFYMDKDDVLLSDNDLWLAAYSSIKLYIHPNKKEEERRWDIIEKKLIHECGDLWRHPNYYYPSFIQHEIEKSWERIFDMDLKHWDINPERQSIQATLWEIPIENITQVDKFIAR